MRRLFALIVGTLFGPFCLAQTLTPENSSLDLLAVVRWATEQAPRNTFNGRSCDGFRPTDPSQKYPDRTVDGAPIDHGVRVIYGQDSLSHKVCRFDVEVSCALRGSSCIVFRNAFTVGLPADESERVSQQVGCDQVNNGNALSRMNPTFSIYNRFTSIRKVTHEEGYVFLGRADDQQIELRFTPAGRLFEIEATNKKGERLLCELQN